jgi:hypothetical protein
VILSELKEEQLAIAQDPRDQIVEIVSDGAGESPIASIFCACR